MNELRPLCELAHTATIQTLEANLREAREKYLETFSMDDFGKWQTAEEKLARFHESKAEEEMKV